MKKRLTLLLVIFVNISYICFSQATDDRRSKIKSIQANYYTKELILTPEESDKFWPVYNKYLDEIRAVRKNSRKDQIATEEGILNVRKKYKPNFRDLLGSDARVNKLFVVERNFWDMLRKELIKRRINDKSGNTQRRRF